MTSAPPHQHQHQHPRYTLPFSCVISERLLSNRCVKAGDIKMICWGSNGSCVMVCSDILLVQLLFVPSLFAVTLSLRWSFFAPMRFPLEEERPWSVFLFQRMHYSILVCLQYHGKPA